jgi:hypothetical protein
VYTALYCNQVIFRKGRKNDREQKVNGGTTEKVREEKTTQDEEKRREEKRREEKRSCIGKQKRRVKKIQKERERDSD